MRTLMQRYIKLHQQLLLESGHTVYFCYKNEKYIHTYTHTYTHTHTHTQRHEAGVCYITRTSLQNTNFSAEKIEKIFGKNIYIRKMWMKLSCKNKHTQKQTHAKTNTRKNKHTQKQTHAKTNTRKNKHTQKQTYAKTNTRKNKHTQKQTNKQTNKPTNTHTYTTFQHLI